LEGKDNEAEGKTLEEGQNDKAEAKAGEEQRFLNPPCDVCGSGMKVNKPEGVFNYPGQGPTQCNALEYAGFRGLIPADSCPLLPALIAYDCDCVPKA
jgi:hypothetical protein